MAIVKTYIVVLAAILSGVPSTVAQSISSVGTAGGSGPSGGIGDSSHPVKTSQCFVTDAQIPDYNNVGNARQLANCSSPSPGPGSGNVRTVKIDSANGARQELIGFGHGWTDSAVQVFSELNSDKLDEVLNDLFGQEGNNMGFMRHTIGSSDLSEDNYFYQGPNIASYNQVQADPSLNQFSLTSNGSAMASMIAKAGTYKSDVTLFGSPWSAPGWMKNNNAFVSDSSNSSPDQNVFNDTWIDTYADYLGKYVDAFKQSGVTINAITPQNEPLNTQGGYPTMYLDSDGETNLINNALGKAMKQRNVNIWAYDHNTDNTEYPQAVVSGASDYVSGAAWHCYQTPQPDYSVLSDFHSKNPNALQFMSECITYRPQTGDYNWQVPLNFMLPVQNYASGATMWVMATDPQYGPHTADGGCDGCSGSIIVNSPDSYTKTQDYYLVGQFSRFIRRGAVNYNVVEGNQGTISDSQQFFVVSAKNPDNSWTVVFMNNAGSDQEVSLQFTDGSPSWSGNVASNTVTTWLIPASNENSSSGSSSAAPSSGPAPSSSVASSVPASSAPASSASASFFSVETSSVPASPVASVASSAAGAPALLQSSPAVMAANGTTNGTTGINATTSVAVTASATGAAATGLNTTTVLPGSVTNSTASVSASSNSTLTTSLSLTGASAVTAAASTSTKCPPRRIRTVTQYITL